MIAAAKEAAGRAGQALMLIESRTEDLPEDLGRFNVVTIGRALHWMDREPTLVRLERLVAPAGMILVCSSRSVNDARNPWLDDDSAARRVWSAEACGRRQAATSGHIATSQDFFAARGFTQPKRSRSRAATRSACATWRAVC